MALIRSSVFSEVRGSIGGTTYSRNKSGAIARNRTKPTNPQTAAQTTVRNRFAATATAWRTLTIAERETWNTMAPLYPYLNKVGEVSTYSGQQLFNKLNGNLNAVNYGNLTICLPPAGFAPVILTGADADITGDTFTVDLASTVAGEGYTIEATPRMSAGISNLKKYYKQVLTTTGVTASANIKAGYDSVYGLEPSQFQADDCIYVRVSQVNLNTGQMQLVGEVKVLITP